MMRTVAGGLFSGSMDPNGARYRPGQPQGHYESWFCRANHPMENKAFWIRYTIFSPTGFPQSAQGELWAVYFDADAGEVIASRQDVPIDVCDFGRRGLDVRVGEAELRTGSLEGEINGPRHRIGWRLMFDGDEAPLFLLSPGLYRGALPKAKAIVPSPSARFNGRLQVDGRTIDVDGWRGSQNHNWGSEHTDRYAWGQVAGFDGAPDAFLELITAQIKIGPVNSPKMTALVLRLGGEELRFDTFPRAVLRTQAHYEPFYWTFSARDGATHLSGSIVGRPSEFVALPYRNPPGGVKTCLNTKVARCDLQLIRPGREPLSLRSERGTAFEILTSNAVPPGVVQL